MEFLTSKEEKLIVQRFSTSLRMLVGLQTVYECVRDIKETPARKSPSRRVRQRQHS